MEESNFNFLPMRFDISGEKWQISLQRVETLIIRHILLLGVSRLQWVNKKVTDAGKKDDDDDLVFYIPFNII